MSDTPVSQAWPDYTFIIPQIYTRAGVRLVGLGNYAPSGTRSPMSSLPTSLPNWAIPAAPMIWNASPG